MIDDWQVKVLEVAEFHESQTKIHGTPVPSKVKNGWSINDTASHFNISAFTVSYDLRLAKALKTNPEKFSGISKNRAIELMKQGEGELIELRYSRSLVTGRLVKVVKHDDYDYYMVKLTKPLVTNALDVELLIIPAHHCKILRES